MTENLYKDRKDENFGAFVGRFIGEHVVDHTIASDEKEIVIMRVSFETERKSGKKDLLTVLYDKDVFSQEDFMMPNLMRIKGRLVSHKKKQPDGKNRLEVAIIPKFIKEFVPNDDGRFFDPNVVKLTANVISKPSYRVTPNKRELCDFMVSIPGRNSKEHLVPVIAWEKFASELSEDLKVGDKIRFAGRLQSRDFVKEKAGGVLEKRTVHEVSVSRIKILSDEKTE